MVPDPMCPTCQSEFVEKIEEENDPRAFAESAQEHEHGGEEGDEVRETLSLEDLFHLFHALSGAPRTQQQQQQQQQGLGLGLGQGQGQGQGQQPPVEFPGVLPFIFNPEMMPSRTGTGTGTATTQADTDGTTSLIDEDVEMTDAMQNEERRQPRDPSVSLATLLESIGFDLQYGGAQGGPPNPLGGLGRLFNMVGNPGDYVFGQGGLDDVITQMMELQSRQSGPVGASDEVINSIPVHKLTTEELDAKCECSVCKDEFTTEDTCLKLGCNHIFHDDCIKPWLKTNGSCPTCRFSLVSETTPAAEDRPEERTATSMAHRESTSDNRASTPPSDDLD
ncbi:hypothetical protein BGZ67_009689 [Mortierella alpina]|nr:hypothetical protein BGZ67_009689 [Mortierella alpina]